MRSFTLRSLLSVGALLATTAVAAPDRLEFKCEVHDSARRTRGLEEKLMANATVTVLHDDTSTRLVVDSPVLHADLTTKVSPRWDVVTGRADGFSGPSYFGRELAMLTDLSGDLGIGVDPQAATAVNARVLPPYAAAHKNLSSAVLVRYKLKDKPKDTAKEAVLENCAFDAKGLQKTLGFKFVTAATDAAAAKVVGFDIDDTLLWSEPAFRIANKAPVEPFSKEYWRIVNVSDDSVSRVKRKGLELVRWHKAKGARVIAITKRMEAGRADHVREFIESTFGIAKADVFFEPEGKTDRIKNEKVTLYYGDSDGDIENAKAAGATGVRFLRSPHSSYRGDYNVGKFGEEILIGSYDEL